MMFHLRRYNELNPQPLSGEIYEEITNCQLANSKEEEADKVLKSLTYLVRHGN